MCFLLNEIKQLKGHDARFDEGQLAPHEEGGGGGVFGIYSTDSTFKKIRSFTNTLLQRDNRVIESCVESPAGVVKDPISCKHTWVDGVPGTGFEGPHCDIDVNECVRGTATCPPDAGCLNLRGSFRSVVFYENKSCKSKKIKFAWDLRCYFIEHMYQAGSLLDSSLVLLFYLCARFAYVLQHPQQHKSSSFLGLCVQEY